VKDSQQRPECRRWRTAAVVPVAVLAWAGLGMIGGVANAAGPAAPAASSSHAADATGAGNDNGNGNGGDNGNGGNGNGNGNGGDWFGTARLRVGYAVDRALFYVTGGLAFTDGSNRNNNGFFGGNNFGGTSAGIPAPFFVGAAPAPAVVATNTGFFGNNDRNNIGWALGGGIEYAFTNNLSAKIEYLHLGFDRNRNNNGFVGVGNVAGVTNLGVPVVNNGFGNGNRRNNSVDLVRVGLNFRFSGL
jgi:outer membrane immunogenic protein